MISSVRISNFKSLKDIRLAVAPLTVLSGQNGAGKSSFLQALLFASRNALVLRAGKSVDLNGTDYAFGLQNDLFYQWADNLDARIDIADELGSGVSLSMSSGPDKSDWDTIDVLRRSFDENMAAYLFRIQYLSATRLAPQTRHLLKRSAISATDWGKNGENAVAILSDRKDEEVAPILVHGNESDTSLQGQIDAWMQAISPGAAIRTEQKIDHVDMKVFYGRGRGGRGFRPENVGFGISIVLPVLAMVLSAQKGDCLIIENPEAHLHPRGQAAVGRLLAKAAAAGIQLFVETHSDHVINGIRVAVKRGEIDHRKSTVAFFERKTAFSSNGMEEQFATVRQLSIDENGELDDYPDGFLDEWTVQLTELL